MGELNRQNKRLNEGLIQSTSKIPTPNPTPNVTSSCDSPLLVGGGSPKHILSDFSSRRQFLTTAGLTTAGMFIAGADSDASIFGFGNKPVPGIPHAWVQAKGANVLRYARYVQSLNLRNITPRMVLAPHFKTRGRLGNTLPPKSYWQRMGPTLKVVDKMISQMGAPLKEVTSAYRSPSYNRAVGGRSQSYHMQNMALDLKFQGVSPYHAAYVAGQLRSRGFFRGGIGRYSSFLHIDTRGTNVNWRG